MRGDHDQLTVTTTLDDATGEEKPLFGFPIQVCKATSSTDVTYDRATPNGSEYEQVYRDKVTDEIFAYGDLIRGVRTGDSFAQVDDDLITNIDEQTALEDVRVERAHDLADVPRERISGFYYVQSPAKGGSHKAYRLLMEALRGVEKGKGKRPAKALRVKFTARKRQRTGIIYTDERRDCLVLNTLTFAADVREPDEAVRAPQLAEVEQAQVDTCRKVIDALDTEGLGDFDTPTDDAIELKRELVAKAAQGEAIAPKKKVEAAATDELAAALEASVAAVG